MRKRSGQNPGAKEQEHDSSPEHRSNGEVAFPRYNVQEFPWTVMILLWCLVIVMLIGVPYLASMIPPTQRTDIHWWQTAVIYQVPTTTNGKGKYFTEFVYKKIEELHDLGIKAVRLGNLFNLAPDGAVLDYMSLNQEYGNLPDFLALMELLKENDIRIVIDIPIAYTSTAHHWFKDDEVNKSRDSIYLWNDAPEIKNDNNLEISWNKSNVRQEYYLHVKDQTKLALINYSSKQAYQRLQAVFYYWIKYGVNGFILLNCDRLIFSQSDIYSINHHQFEQQDDIKLQKLADLIQSIKRDFNAFQLQLDNSGPPSDNDILLAMDFDCGDYGTCQSLYKSGVDLVINKHILSSSTNVSLEAVNLIDIERNVKLMLSRVPIIYTHNWMICQGRSLHNIRDDSTLQLINMIHLFLPGTALICEAQLPQKKNADYASAREHFQMLIRWRQTSAMSWGQIQLNLVDKDVFSFVRYAFGKMYPRYIIIIHLGHSIHRRYNFTMKQKGLVVPELGTLRYSKCLDNGNEPTQYTANSSISLNDTYIKPKCGLLVEMNLKIFW